MKLSGWTRLWIVASLVIWIGGFFWLQTVNYPQPGAAEASERDPLRMPPLQPDFSVCRPSPTAGDGNPFDQFDENPECRAFVQSDWNFTWSHWLSQSIKVGHLQLIALGPLILGALMLGIGWIRKGFAKPAPEKKDSAESG